MSNSNLNPLLVKPEIHKNVTGGREGRKSKRFRRVQKIEAKVCILLQSLLPSLAYLPVRTKEYPFQLPILLDQLKNEFSSAEDHANARRYLSNFIEKGNQERIWSIEPPEKFVKLRRHPQMRTLRWHQRATSCSKLVVEYEEVLKDTNNFSCLSPHELLSLVALSASLYGGLCQSKAIVGLVNKLQSEKPIQYGTLRDQELIFVEFIVENAKIHNSSIDGKAALTKRWYVDTLSLGLIKQYLDKSTQDENIQKYTEDSLYKAVKTSLKKLGIATPFSSLNSLSLASVSSVENIPGVDISSAMVETMNGRNVTASLSKEYWRQILLPTILKIPSINFTEFEKWQQSINFSSSKKLPVTGVMVREIEKELKSTLIIKDSRGRKQTANSAIKKLEEIDSTGWGVAGECLKSWYKYLLNKQGLKVSSVHRYHYAIAKHWLMANAELDFNTLSDDEFYEIYKNIIENTKSMVARHYRAKRLDVLHQYASEYFGLAELEETLSSGDNATPMVRAGYITKDLFDATFSCIGEMLGLDGNSKLSIQVLLIIAYRTGLRLNELTKIRLSEIEFSDDYWIFIRSNPYGDNKRDGSLRKIPLGSLLVKNEYKFFQQYLGLRQKTSNSKKELFFCRDGLVYEPWDGQVISKLVNGIMRRISGLDGMTFHHLRHTALSNLHLILEREWDIAQELTGYEIQDCERVFEAVCGNKNEQLRIYWALACFAGHNSPKTTFQSYLHFSDLITHLKIRKNCKLFTLSHCKTFSDISANKVTRICKKNNQNPKKIKVELFRPVLIEECMKWIEKVNNVKAENRVQDNVKSISFETAITHNVTYKIIKCFENGYSITDLVYQFNVNEEKIEKWMSNAKQLANLKTREEKSRLIASTRSENNKIILLPAPLNDPQEYKDADDILKILRRRYKENKKSIHTAIKYYLTATNISSAGIKFLDKKKLVVFIKSMSDVIPMNRWLLIANLDEKSDKAKAIQYWSMDGKLKVTIDISASIKSKKNAYLYLRHPSEKTLLEKNEKYKKYSARTLRYVFHMIAIMVFDDTDIKGL
ncbi:MAG: tyrosine-type recombinase/integrase [Pseudomonadota bacterium]